MKNIFHFSVKLTRGSEKMGCEADPFLVENSCREFSNSVLACQGQEQGERLTFLSFGSCSCLSKLVRMQICHQLVPPFQTILLGGKWGLG